MPAVQIFLSTVSAEFQSYREALRRDLDRPNVTVKVQEDFIAGGGATLEKLDDYIRQCDAVIHLVGDMTGAVAEGPSMAAMLRRYPDLLERLPPLRPLLATDAAREPLSYTQWEAWLALYHRKTLLIAVPRDGAVRDARYQCTDAERAAQQAHLRRLQALERYPEIHFTSADRLAVELLRSGLQDIVARTGGVRQAVHLPNRSLGALFVGRGRLLAQIAEHLGPVPDTAQGAAAALVLSGLSGSGKTRLAVEYAWQHAARHSAVLFAPANSPQALRSNIAALCGSAVLNLPEQRAPGEDAQFEAVLRWLRQHPGWLLILDNLDSEDDAQAVEALLPQLMGGHVLLTSTLGFWSGAIAVQGVGVLGQDEAVALLLERTAGRRRARPDDAATAAALAQELGGLPLALEQAAAYISTRRLALAQYVQEWRNTSSGVLAWFDARLMGCEHSVATTWQTAFDQLGPGARGLLGLLAWFDASPIPEALLDQGGGGIGTEAWAALSELESHSLVTRNDAEPDFSVHRLVQQVTRRRQATQREDGAALEAALRWLDGAFAADLGDPVNWPVLESLVMHARAVSLAAADAGIGAPADTLMQRVGRYQANRERHADAEALQLRALGLLRQRLGPGDPVVGNAERGLGVLYATLDREAQSLPLLQSALAIAEAHPGPGAIDLGRALRALALLHGTTRGDLAEGLVRRAISAMEQAGPSDGSILDGALTFLGTLLAAMGRRDEGRTWAERALRNCERRLGPDHADTADALMALARASSDEEGVALAQRAIGIYRATLGPEHSNLANALNVLGLQLAKLGRHDEAEATLGQALSIFEAAYGTDHPALVSPLEALAWMVEVRQLNEAVAQRRDRAAPMVRPAAWLRRALAILQASHGPAHPETLRVQARLAQVLKHDPESRPEGIALMTSAVEGSLRVLGPDHAGTRDRQQQLAAMLAPPAPPPQRHHVAPAGSEAEDEAAWQGLFQRVGDGLYADVRQQIALGPRSYLHVHAMAAGAGSGSGLMTLSIDAAGDLALTVWCGETQVHGFDAGCRAALLAKHGFMALGDGVLHLSLGHAAAADAVALVGLMTDALFGGFQLPHAGVELGWTEPCIP